MLTFRASSETFLGNISSKAAMERCILSRTPCIMSGLNGQRIALVSYQSSARQCAIKCSNNSWTR